MKVHARIQKWGNGLALRVCGPLRDIPHFKEGTEVNIEITEDGFIVKKSLSKKINSQLPFSEARLLKGLTASRAHSDLLTDPLPKEFEQK